MASYRRRTLDDLVRSYIPDKKQEQALDLLSHLIMLEPEPRDLLAMVNHQEAKYQGLYRG